MGTRGCINYNLVLAIRQLGYPMRGAPLEDELVMQSYPARALGRRLQVDWARDPREGLRVLMSLRVDFEPMG